MTGTQMQGGPLISAPAEETPPAVFGKYRVVTRLGGGGFGTVWRCADDALGREVAVKALTGTARQDPELRDRFLLEARALARVNHSAVVQVFDVGDGEHGPFFVMELVAGRDLEHIVKESGPLGEARALMLLRCAVGGLQAAAEAGVVHRDIKPANLMVTGTVPRENVKVTDFGLAFPTSSAGPRITAPTVILGTPDYISPEQARGLNVDLRADMYSLGCTLHELLTGSPPFQGPTPQSILALHLTQVPDPVRSKRPEITVATNNLVLRLLAKEASGRFATYAELQDALENAIGGAPGVGAPSTTAISGALVQQPGPALPSGTTRVESSVVTENLALCFVDLLDFQERTRQQTREENSEWVGQFGDGMKRLVRQCGGRFIKQVYGTVLCSFVSPTDAVLFGMAAVDAAWGWSRGRPPIMTHQLRVGINLGEVRVDHGDVFGDAVNVAARVMSKAAPSDVWFSDAVWLAMNRSEVEAEGVGSHELKGVPVPVRLFRSLPARGHVPSEHAPPFGVRPGARSGGGDALIAIDKRARELVSGVGKAAQGARVLTARAHPLLLAVGRAAVAVRDRVPPQHRRKVAIGVPALFVTTALLLFVPRWMDPYRREIELIEDGKSAAAARLLETRTAESPRAQWLYGKARIASGKKLEGLEQWETALSRDAKLADNETLEGILASMDMKDRLPRKILVKYYGARARERLKATTQAERYWVRHHAALALREMDMDGDVDWPAVYLKDIRLETECGRRQAAVRSLEEMGNARALSAVSSARAEPGGEPGCVTEMLAATERRLKKKVGTP